MSIVCWIIRQIKEKQYVETLREYAGEIVLVGINYDKRTKQHTCVIERNSDKATIRFSVSGKSLDHTESSQKSGQTGGQSLSGRTRELLELLKANPFATRAELSAALQISPSAVQKHLEKLKQGYIRRAGGDFGGHWEIITTDR